MPDLEDQLRAYGTVLDRADAFQAASVAAVAPTRTRRSFVVAIAVVVTVVAVVAVTVRAARSTSSPRPKIVTPGPEPSSPVTAGRRPSSLEVVDDFGVWAPAVHPFAFAGGRVWVAHVASDRFGRAVIDGYDPSSARLETTITPPEREVFAITGEGDALWVTAFVKEIGDESVSRIDARSGRVLFTTRLPGTPCVCPVVAGPAGVWLVGDHSHDAFRLSPTDGHVIADVPIEPSATTAIQVRDRLIVGRYDGAIDEIDPATNSIQHTIPRPLVGDAPVEWVMSMTPATVPAIGSDPPIDAFILRRNRTIWSVFADAWNIDAFAYTDFEPSTIVNVGTNAWVFGGDRLYVTTTHAVMWNEFRYADRKFTPATGSSDGASHFGDAVVAGGTVWSVIDHGSGSSSIVVVKAPTPFPFR